MCTVSFLPISKKHFILTSNRDEAIERPSAVPFTKYNVNNKDVYFPKDQKANGTWIAHDPRGNTICLLNGAFEKHKSESSYRLSRGLMVLDFFEFSSPNDFVENYNFTGIEPFTLIIIDKFSNEYSLQELRWDGKNTHFFKLDELKPRIWSSSTLYTMETKELREKWFNSFLSENQEIDPQKIIRFHHFEESKSSKNNLIFEDQNKKTVSISCIDCNEMESKIKYYDLRSNENYENYIVH
jgi:uncharacterized protein with NRDE domain